MNFGKNLTIFRKRKNLSQEELAFIVGVSRQTIYTWEADIGPGLVVLRLGIGGLDGAGVPGVSRNVAIGGLAGGGSLPAEEAAQNHCEGRAGHLMAHTEAGGALTVEEPQLHAPVNACGGPMAGGNVLKFCSGGGCHERTGQHGAQSQAGQDPIQTAFHKSPLFRG